MLSHFGLVSECRLAPRVEETGLKVNEAKLEVVVDNLAMTAGLSEDKYVELVSLIGAAIY